MSRRSEQTSPFDDIEALLDEARVEEVAQLAVLEALGELDDPEWDEPSLGERPWSDFSLHDIWLGDLSLEELLEEGRLGTRGFPDAEGGFAA